MTKAPHIYQRPLRAEFAAVILDYLFDLFSPKQKPAHNQVSSLHPGVLEAIWIGHATFLINFYGKHILTDPMFSDRALIAKRKVAPSLHIQDMPAIDMVLLSHSHFDHMDTRSLAKLDRLFSHCQFVVPQGYKRYLRWMRNQVVEIGHHQTMAPAGISVTASPPEHMTNRFPWQRFEHLNAYTLQYKGKSLFFAGDTAFAHSVCSQVPRQPDVALLPIGAYEPSILERVHQTPEQALQMAHAIGAKHVIPMHFETFRLSFEDMHEPRRRFIEASQRYPFATYPLEIGQKVVFDSKVTTGRIL